MRCPTDQLLAGTSKKQNRMRGGNKAGETFFSATSYQLMPRATKKVVGSLKHSPYFKDTTTTTSNKNNDSSINNNDDHASKNSGGSTIIKQQQQQDEDEEDDGMPVPDNIDYDLKVLFVGINPGLISAAKGHHFAGPTNHFWPCLSASGLVDRKVTFVDDVNLPALYRVGITNLTMRSSRKASDLTMAEQRAGIPTLTAKFRRYRPRVACFVGKGIYEIYSGKKCKQMGLQAKRIPWDDQQGATQLFVMPSTSGLVSAYQKPDKIKFFQHVCRIAEEEDAKYQEEEEDGKGVSSKHSNPHGVK
ncbi:uracil-DNA glycosylase-like protein [Zychaea mexicana]|uniref:uracil-DNA glycosylase-like protein n=1 Tax=Zychaea mexicana TaxID=64656 RepID=UPI0022FF1B8E|nr:uracil-DNA glycosylase-like protein [Zychaea mexicana]KAI9489505.1 uracil-DNA glycosylase-like protein [Zychaea mexicana]